MKILVTGAAGFIGMHVARRLCKEGHDVTGLDNINGYYDTSLKYRRLSSLGITREDILYNKKLCGENNFSFIELDLADAGNLNVLFAKEQFEVVINLAAQAGVRHSINNPNEYIHSNIIGFFNVLEACRAFPVSHLLFASSSSVYGNSHEIPFRVGQNTDAPISLYAASKKTNEVMAYTYAHLYGIPATGLRFFTVYGPWGRPDMAYFQFTKSILEETPIHLYSEGKLRRDFTYIDDIAEAISRMVELPPLLAGKQPAYRLLNIGNQNPVEVRQFVEILEHLLGKKATIINRPMQPGDVEITYADTTEIEQLTGFTPRTSLKDGLTHFVTWYLKHQQQSSE